MSAKRNHLYVIEGGGFFKIGISTNVPSRFSGLQTSNPFPLRLLKSWQTDEAENYEKRLHRKFSRFRKSGEWFALPESEVNKIATAERLDELVSV